MKIAFVRARYSSHGGAERFAARALEALAAQDGDAVALTIVARSWDAPSPSVRVIACDPFYLGSTWRDASFARAVRHAVERESFDLVQSHERIVGLPVYRAGDGVHAAWLERRGRASSRLQRMAVALNPHHRYLVATERAMFEHAALRAVICNSRMVMNEIATRFAIDPARLVLVRNGVDVARFHPDAKSMHRTAMRARLDLDEATPTFVLLGSGFERKGVAQAVRALVEVADAALVIVGTDKHAARYRALAAALGVTDRVRFTGAVDDVLPYLAMADACVLPTLYDPFPNGALEAWACGLPVLTTDASGAAELIVEGVNGWVVPAARHDALVTAMKAAARRDAGCSATMAAAARATAEPLSLPALATALATLYRGLLERARAETPVIDSSVPF